MYKSLKELAVITMGQSPKSSCYNTHETGIPFLQGRTTFGRVYPSYDTWSSQWNKEALPNDILFTVRAPVGDVNISKDRIAIGRGIASIRAINCNPRYLFYLLQANNSIFTSNSTGTIFESINKETLENTLLNVHSNEKQVHIVDTIHSVLIFQ
jgi:Restriction endonuclease S subunits